MTSPRAPGRRAGGCDHTGFIEPSSTDEITSAIRTHHLHTPIARVTPYDLATPAQAAAAGLEAAGFDFAPVTSGGTVCGYVRGDDISDGDGVVEQHLRRITGTTIVASTTPMATLMPGLEACGFLFVVEGRDIVGIVTPADLNKQPGRTYFYMLVAALELDLDNRVRAYFADQEEAAALLSAGRGARVRQRLADQTHDDVAADYVAVMELTDLLAIVGKTVGVLEVFGEYTRNRWQSEVSSPVIRLRHQVMHSVRTLATNAPTSLKRLIALD